MNTKRLEAFLAVVRCGSFAAASERLHMTQSAISLRIRELEQELDIPLFDRSGRKAVLTAEGRGLIRHAEAVIAAVEEMKHSFGINKMVVGTVRVGVAELIAVTWLPQLVGILQKRFPRLVVELQVGTAYQIVDRVKRDQLDVALMPGTSFDSELESLALGTVEFQWVAAPEIATPSYDWAADDAPPVLLLSRDSYITHTADAWFRQNQIVPQRVSTCNSMNVLAALAANGLGVALLPTFHYSEQLSSGTLKVIDAEPRITAAFFAIFRDQGLSSPSRLLATIAREVSTFPATL